MKFLFLQISLLLTSIGAETQPSLSNTNWKFVKIEDKENKELLTFPLKGLAYTQGISFQDSTYGGSACNGFSSKYRIIQDSIIGYGDIISTLKNCGEELNHLDELMHGILRSKYLIRSDTLFISSKGISYTLIKR